MQEKNDVEVIINNKRYTICGYESGEYLQKIASYINSKYNEFKLTESYGRLDTDMKNILLEINIADDYFKAKEHVREVEEESEAKNNEIFDMKHEAISIKTRLEAVQKEYEILKREYNEAQKQIVRLETELEDAKRG